MAAEKKMSPESQVIMGRVREIAEPIVQSLILELVDVEYRREARGWVLRLFIDKAGGVTLDDCTQVSHEVGRALDVEEVISTAYTLEVSSPGLDRPLRTERDFLKYRNRKVRVKTREVLENRRVFRGELIDVTRDRITVREDDRLFEIPLEMVSRANLEIDI
jgi:ribosome maturation factor RimP